LGGAGVVIVLVVGHWVTILVMIHDELGEYSCLLVGPASTHMG
jgi:hypothetical protein